MNDAWIAAAVIIVGTVLIMFTAARGMSAWRFWQETVAPWLERQTRRTRGDDDEPPT